MFLAKSNLAILDGALVTGQQNTAAVRIYSSLTVGIFLSMTTLLTHTVAHSTKPSFMPKTNN